LSERQGNANLRIGDPRPDRDLHPTVPEAASLKAAAREECVRSKLPADFCHNNAAALLTAGAHR